MNPSPAGIEDELEDDVTPVPEQTLSAADRCDACGARAYASALLENGELLFCGHHWARYAEKVQSICIRHLDETQFI